MKDNKRNFKEEFNDWWDENKTKIKIGVKCLVIGLGVGFIKGVLTTNKLHERNLSAMIDRLPPEETDCRSYIETHIDEFKPFIKEEMSYSHDYLEES